MYGLRPSPFVTGKSGSTTSSVTLRIEKSHDSVDIDRHLLLVKELVESINIGGGVGRWIPEECAAHAKKSADALTDLSPPTFAVGNATGKIPRGDGQDSSRVHEGVLDGSFADPWIVDQRVSLTEILE